MVQIYTLDATKDVSLHDHVLAQAETGRPHNEVVSPLNLLPHWVIPKGGNRKWVCGSHHEGGNRKLVCGSHHGKECVPRGAKRRKRVRGDATRANPSKDTVQGLLVE